MIPRECEWVVGALARVVPRTTRDAWLRKWDADLWFHDFEARRRGRSESRARWIVRRRCLSIPADAMWQRYDREKAVHRTMKILRSPSFCLAMLAAAVVAILIVSDGASATRRSLFGPAFTGNGRIAVIRARDPIFPRMDPITPTVLDRVRSKATAFQDVAAYSFWRSWIQKEPGRYASFAHVLVSPSFFQTLGVRATDGRVFDKDDANRCFDCLVVTERFHRRYLNPFIAAVGQTIEFDAKKWRVIGTLPSRFWFLTPEAGAFSVMRPDSGVQRVIPVVRLRPGVSASDAENDLRWFTPRDLLEVTLVAETLGEPVRFLGAATLLVLLGIAVGAGIRIYKSPLTARYWLFFFAKCVLALSGVLLFVMEFTGVGSLTNVVVRTVGSELLAGWLWVAGTILFMWWALRDQHRRCRTCQRRLVLPVRVGPTDRVLFDHEGTELLCPAGHGTLYVEGATETFLHGEQWRHLDDSWQDLFR